MPEWVYRVEWIDTTEKYLVGYSSGSGRTQANWAPLNDLGAEGWEMISASFQFQSGEGIAIFKRELGYIHPHQVEVGEDALTKDSEPAEARRGADAMKAKSAQPAPAPQQGRAAGEEEER